MDNSQLQVLQGMYNLSPAAEQECPRCGGKDVTYVDQDSKRVKARGCTTCDYFDVYED